MTTTEPTTTTGPSWFNLGEIVDAELLAQVRECTAALTDAAERLAPTIQVAQDVLERVTRLIHKAQSELHEALGDEVASTLDDGLHSLVYRATGAMAMWDVMYDLAENISPDNAKLAAIENARFPGSAVES